MARYDVVVIGGGMAGVAAALRARAEGRSVCVVRAGPGATALTPGCWNASLPPEVRTALRDVDHEYRPVDAALPHVTGALRRAAFAAASHADARVGARTGVVGIAGLPGFRAAALARLWGCGPAAAITLAHTPAAGWSPQSIATFLEREPDALPQSLRSCDLPGSCEALILPPVLGLGRASAVRAHVSSALSIPVHESLAATPSIPGLRLDAALMRALARAKIELIHARVVSSPDASARKPGRELQQVRLHDGRAIDGARFVLATGRFIGGGIATRATPDSRTRGDHALVEPALGLPVWLDLYDRAFTTADALTLTSRVRTNPQPLLGAGVHVDAAARPVDARGTPLFSNVQVFGDVCAARSAAGSSVS